MIKKTTSLLLILGLLLALLGTSWALDKKKFVVVYQVLHPGSGGWSNMPWGGSPGWGN